MVLNGLFRETSMGWHLEVQPAGIARVSVFASNNCSQHHQLDERQTHRTLKEHFRAECQAFGIQLEYV